MRQDCEIPIDMARLNRQRLLVRLPHVSYSVPTPDSERETLQKKTTILHAITLAYHRYNCIPLGKFYIIDPRASYA